MAAAKGPLHGQGALHRVAGTQGRDLREKVLGDADMESADSGWSLSRTKDERMRTMKAQACLRLFPVGDSHVCAFSTFLISTTFFFLILHVSLSLSLIC